MLPHDHMLSPGRCCSSRSCRRTPSPPLSLRGALFVVMGRVGGEVPVVVLIITIRLPRRAGLGAGGHLCRREFLAPVIHPARLVGLGFNVMM